MAPNCAVVDVTSDGALVICVDQGVYLTRNGLARLSGLPVDKVRVQYSAGSNTYGSSCYREAAQAAAILSQEVGRPVRLQLSRADEFGWDNYGPAQLAELRAAVDADGKLVALRVSGVEPHRRKGSRPRRSSRSATATADHSRRAAAQCALPGSFIPNGHVRRPESAGSSIIVVVGGGYLRTGAMRAPMDPSMFFAQEG